MGCFHIPKLKKTIKTKPAMKKKNSGTGSVGTFFYRKTVDFEMSAHLTYLETEGSFKL